MSKGVLESLGGMSAALLEQSPLAPTLEADHPQFSLETPIHCLQCGRLARRYEYCGDSKVVIDACPGHGVWLDDGELSGVMAYLRRSEGPHGARSRESAPRPPGFFEGLSRWFRGL